jgi:N6-L-threonylcarbamoyladenine synthase
MSPKSLPPLILAIDTSCDETSGAVSLGRVILSNVIASQAQIHQQYGGVYPTLAKRAHQKNIDPVIKASLDRAQIKADQLDAIAVTKGPGLAPALEIGVNKAAKLADQWQKPLMAINHIEAHALSVLAHRNSRSFATKKIINLKESNERQDLNETDLDELRFASWQRAEINQELPVLAIVVSGGHSEFILVSAIGHYQVLGQTIDDAAGEALDKVGRMLNLGYPAGPVVEELAKKGNSDRFEFPLPMTTVNNFNLSYSGLKTSAHRLVTKLKEDNQLDQQTIFDFAASFQQAVFRHITYKLEKILADIDLDSNPINQVWLGGGVASNIKLRRMLRSELKKYQLPLVTPYEKRLCGDNAAMIGTAANFHYQADNFVTNHDQIDRKPSWPIDQLSY